MSLSLFSLYVCLFQVSPIGPWARHIAKAVYQSIRRWSGASWKFVIPTFRMRSRRPCVCQPSIHTNGAMRMSYTWCRPCSSSWASWRSSAYPSIPCASGSTKSTSTTTKCRFTTFGIASVLHKWWVLYPNIYIRISYITYTISWLL